MMESIESKQSDAKMTTNSSSEWVRIFKNFKISNENSEVRKFKRFSAVLYLESFV